MPRDRDRKTTPEMVTLQLDSSIVRRLRRRFGMWIGGALVTALGASGGVLYVAERTDETATAVAGKAAAAEVQHVEAVAQTAVVRTQVINLEREAAYQALKAAVEENQRELEIVKVRLNDLLLYSTRERRKRPAPLELDTPRPLPSSPEDAAQKQKESSDGD
jgi:hypothetical protein